MKMHSKTLIEMLKKRRVVLVDIRFKEEFAVWKNRVKNQDKFKVGAKVRLIEPKPTFTKIPAGSIGIIDDVSSRIHSNIITVRFTVPESGLENYPVHWYINRFELI